MSGLPAPTWAPTPTGTATVLGQGAPVRIAPGQVWRDLDKRSPLERRVRVLRVVQGYRNGRAGLFAECEVLGTAKPRTTMVRAEVLASRRWAREGSES